MFQKTYNLASPNHEEIINLYRTMNRKIESIIKNFLTKKSPRPNIF